MTTGLSRNPTTGKFYVDNGNGVQLLVGSVSDKADAGAGTVSAVITGGATNIIVNGAVTESADFTLPAGARLSGKDGTVSLTLIGNMTLTMGAGSSIEDLKIIIDSTGLTANREFIIVGEGATVRRCTIQFINTHGTYSATIFDVNNSNDVAIYRLSLIFDASANRARQLVVHAHTTSYRFLMEDILMDMGVADVWGDNGIIFLIQTYNATLRNIKANQPVRSLTNYAIQLSTVAAYDCHIEDVEKVHIQVSAAGNTHLTNLRALRLRATSIVKIDKVWNDCILDITSSNCVITDVSDSDLILDTDNSFFDDIVIGNGKSLSFVASSDVNTFGKLTNQGTGTITWTNSTRTTIDTYVNRRSGITFDGESMYIGRLLQNYNGACYITFAAQDCRVEELTQNAAITSWYLTILVDVANISIGKLSSRATGRQVRFIFNAPAKEFRLENWVGDIDIRSAGGAVEGIEATNTNSYFNGGNAGTLILNAPFDIVGSGTVFEGTIMTGASALTVSGANCRFNESSCADALNVVGANCRFDRFVEGAGNLIVTGSDADFSDCNFPANVSFNVGSNASSFKRTHVGGNLIVVSNDFVMEHLLSSQQVELSGLRAHVVAASVGTNLVIDGDYNILQHIHLIHATPTITVLGNNNCTSKIIADNSTPAGISGNSNTFRESVNVDYNDTGNKNSYIGLAANFTLSGCENTNITESTIITYLDDAACKRIHIAHNPDIVPATFTVDSLMPLITGNALRGDMVLAVNAIGASVCNNRVYGTIGITMAAIDNNVHSNMCFGIGSTVVDPTGSGFVSNNGTNVAVSNTPEHSDNFVIASQTY